MILHVNHMRKGHGKLISSVVSRLLALVEAGKINSDFLTNLHVELDWLQYKANFREIVTVRKSTRNGQLSRLVEFAIDLRRVEQDALTETLEKALAEATSEVINPHRVFLGEFGPMRSSTIWRFNELYWQHRFEWESELGKGYEKALPSGSEDGHSAEVIRESVAEFYDLLREMDEQEQLPPALYVMEIGVGNGSRALQWLKLFQDRDRECGTDYYSSIRYMLCDCSKESLERALHNLGPHRDAALSFEVNAMDPFASLGDFRRKVLYIYLSNVYDNLPTDHAVLRDGRIYLVEVRPYIDVRDVDAICAKYGIDVANFVETVQQLLEVGPNVLVDQKQGLRFWMDLWSKMRLEERMVAVDNLSEALLPSGLKPSHLDKLFTSGSGTIRFQLSSGAVGSFNSTVQLLHPQGYLQVMDIFVTKLLHYQSGFKGPGKLDGSVVNWVNGALLEEVGRGAGYDVHFVPFKYRKGSRTSILYATRREG